MHPEYFAKYQNVTGKQKESQDWHNGKHNLASDVLFLNTLIAHCFSMLKQGVMCQADTTLLTMKWDPDRIMPISNMSSQHECVDWDRLTEWSDPRSFDPTAKGWLVHPNLGKSFFILEDWLKIFSYLPRLGPSLDDGRWKNNFDPVLGSKPEGHT